MSNAVLDLKELATSKGRTTRFLGVSQKYALELIHGTRDAGPIAIAKIAKELNVPTEEVFAACRESKKRAAKSLGARHANQITRRGGA